jgi:DNA repair protein RecO (recombination protein O)
MIKLLRMNFANLHLYRFSRGERNIILDRIITYYSIHLSGMGQLSSPAVLHALFD